MGEPDALLAWARTLSPDHAGWSALCARMGALPPEAQAELVPLLEPALSAWPD